MNAAAVVVKNSNIIIRHDVTTGVIVGFGGISNNAKQRKLIKVDADLKFLPVVRFYVDGLIYR